MKGSECVVWFERWENGWGWKEWVSGGVGGREWIFTSNF